MNCTKIAKYTFSNENTNAPEKIDLITLET